MSALALLFGCDADTWRKPTSKPITARVSSDGAVVEYPNGQKRTFGKGEKIVVVIGGP